MSAWLTSTPSYHRHLSILSKGDFRDAIAIRYGLPLSDAPTSCVCGADLSPDHANTCPTGAYPIQRHNEIRDFLAGVLGEVCYDVEAEPPLAPLTGEQGSGNTADGARVDIRAQGFCARQQSAFFDVRVTHPKASLLSRAQVLSQLAQNEREKKRQYATRIIQVDHGSFTPLVFATNGQIASECAVFLKTLASRLHEKSRDVSYPVIVRCLRQSISMLLLRWQISCIRGSRSSYLKKKYLFMAECRMAQAAGR